MALSTQNLLSTARRMLLYSMLLCLRSLHMTCRVRSIGPSHPRVAIAGSHNAPGPHCLAATCAHRGDVAIVQLDGASRGLGPDSSVVGASICEGVHLPQRKHGVGNAAPCTMSTEPLSVAAAPLQRCNLLRLAIAARAARSVQCRGASLCPPPVPCLCPAASQTCRT